MKISIPESYVKKIKEHKCGLICGAAFAVLLIIDMVHCSEIEGLKAKVAALGDTQPVYVYDVKKIVANYGELVAVQQKYAKQLADLNQQVSDAQKKLANMKDKKAKAEFSDVYLSTLNLKRDTLLEDYEKSINALSEKTNEVLLRLQLRMSLILPAKCCKLCRNSHNGILIHGGRFASGF